MENSPKDLPAILEADGVTIRLESKLDQPAGRIVVRIGSCGAMPVEAEGPSGVSNARYRAYLQHQQAYSKALESFNSARMAAFMDPKTAANWPIAGVQLQMAVDEAFQKWIALGHKSEVEHALATKK